MPQAFSADSGGFCLKPAPDLRRKAPGDGPSSGLANHPGNQSKGVSVKRSMALLSIVAVLPSLFSLTGCAFNTKSDSLRQVDDLLVRIERVHVEAVLSKETTLKGMQSLVMLVNPSDAGAEAAYLSFREAIDASVAQADELRDNVAPMRKGADAFFDKWEDSLEEFTSERMRERSGRRLAETRTRYDRILAAVEPAQEALDGFNDNLNDLALFLEHDFNAAAVAEVQGDVQTLAQEATQLGYLLDAVREMAQEYVASAALVGQLGGAPAVPAETEAAPADGTDRAE